jgi:hypothetical protein
MIKNIFKEISKTLFLYIKTESIQASKTLLNTSHKTFYTYGENKLQFYPPENLFQPIVAQRSSLFSQFIIYKENKVL